MKSKKGFSLIELLAVIVILGILLSISVVAINNIRNKQETKNRINTFSSILTSAKNYISEHPEKIDKNIQYDLDNNRTIVSKINTGDLLSENFLDIDINKYPEFNNKTIDVVTCPNNSTKLEYHLYICKDGNSCNGIWDYKFTDCGCDSQTGNSQGKLLCNRADFIFNGSETVYGGWDSNGKYLKAVDVCPSDDKNSCKDLNF